MSERLRVRLEFKIEDMWVGAFWRVDRRETSSAMYPVEERIDVWVCLLPCLPIHAWWWRRP